MPVSHLSTSINHSPIRKKNRSIYDKSRGINQTSTFRANRLRKLSDPFDGQYKCSPFAETTRGATKEEVEGDIAAIYAGIAAVNARQPVPLYFVDTRCAQRAEVAAKERVEKARERYRPKNRSATSADVEGGPSPRARARALRISTGVEDERPGYNVNLVKPLTGLEETPTQKKPTDRAASKTYVEGKGPSSKVQVTTRAISEETPIQMGFFETRSGAVRVPTDTEGTQIQMKSSIRATAGADTATSMTGSPKTRGAARNYARDPSEKPYDADETEDEEDTKKTTGEQSKSGPRRAPKRAARTQSVTRVTTPVEMGIEVYESINVAQPKSVPSSPPTKKVKMDKSALEPDVENSKSPVPRNLMDYFGSRGSRGRWERRVAK